MSSCNAFTSNTLVCERALWSALAAAREKEGELAIMSLKFEYLHRKSRFETLPGYAPENRMLPLQTPLFCPVLSIGTFFSCSGLCPSKKKTVSNLNVSYSVWKVLDCLPQKRGLPVPDRKIFCLMTLNWWHFTFNFTQKPQGTHRV